MPASTPRYLRRLIVAAIAPEEAMSALPWACMFARQLSLPLVFVSLVDPAETGDEGTAEAAAMARDYLQVLTSDARLAQLEVQTETLVGSADSELARFARQEEGSVLLLVRSGIAPLDAAVPQAVERVIQKLTTPFVVLPSHGVPPSSVHSVVVGRDNSDLAERVILTSQTLGLSLGVKVVTVEAIEPGSMATEAFLAEATSVADRAVRVRGLASRTLLVTAHARDTDLIIVGAHGAGETRHPALGRTADWLVRHADRPVLVVPEVT